MVERVPKFFGEFFGSNFIDLLCLPHLEPTSIKSAKGFAKFCPISYHQNFKKRFSHFLVLFFEFLFASVIPQNQGVKNRGKKGRKTTNFFWSVFWI